ncbi:type II toxin-antitoxin system RelE/ParE family toxin [Desulfobacca acetoxidans]|uniref:Plasmid stabilization system n=1 Tax=Desulfobacca acetoxidans (strain ATCC 700848 / DSM 11109 / ASRB2) TaxID=880072 RepID=F2NJK7_DESAR|nr:type II toxin-antitoxin system mRNA interferase toxin, RelE/StbE family [Desulfobacca acetoxidans]AEB09519.1 plasmid stabilization system [Desulfobacca acetoxidans DSM 11109]
MKIRRTDKFKKDYQDLPKEIRYRFKQKISLLMGNTRHPSLRIHKIKGRENLWELSITMDYRVLFEIEGEYLVFLSVGPHKIVDQI